MDFRGRTYPVPPNLNILGSDFCRGVLMFDEARPLGERGMYWLKVSIPIQYISSPESQAIVLEQRYGWTHEIRGAGQLCT